MSDNGVSAEDRRAPDGATEALLDATLDLIRRQWPYRNDYFGVRLTLRSLIRHAKHLARSVRPEDASTGSKSSSPGGH